MPPLIAPLGLKLAQVAAARRLRRSANGIISELPIWRAAVQAAATGIRNARLLCIGDSTTAGHGANAAGMADNNRSASYPTQLAGIINGRGALYASGSSFVGNQNATNSATFDNRISFGANWQFSSGVAGATLGGYNFLSQGVTKLNFAPINACDTFELYQSRVAGSATNTWKIGFNGGAQAYEVPNYTSPSPPGGFTKHVFTRSLGANTLNIWADDNADHYFSGMVAYNSAVKEITVLNAGWSGAKAGDLNNGSAYAYAPLATIASYAPDLCVINLGINDANQASSTSESAFKAQMQAVISACVAAGADVVLMVPNPIGGSYSANLDLFAGYINALAATNSLPVIDLRTSFVNYTTANAAGWMRDTLHPNATGYGRIATAVANRIYPA